MNIVNQLSAKFREFLKKEGIDEDVFSCEPNLRYIRIKPDFEQSLEYLKENISKELQPINEIPNLFSIPAGTKIINIPLYQEGQLYGIDKSSAAVVYSLDINQSDFNVLEICCAPGAKLTYIADQLRIQKKIDNIDRKVVGVDISQNRLNITQSLVTKYKLDDFVELKLADGTNFTSSIQFDKVLIDAECTHEGSIKHLKKYIQQPIQNQKKVKKNNKASQKQLQKNYTNQYTTEQQKANEWSEEDFINRFLDQKKLSQICDLQYQLLQNGYNLAKKGGIIVYSTCSFSQKQNEEIVIKFLNNNPDSILIHPFYGLMEQICKPGQIFNTVRFDPKISKTGGMFIAKIQKL